MLPRVAQIAVERNIRSILLDLPAACHTPPSSHPTVAALLKCGYKVGLLASESTATGSDAKRSTYVSSTPQTFVEDAARHLDVASSRMLSLLQDQPGAYALRVGTDRDAILTFSSPDAFVQDLLGFARCFDADWTCFGPYGIAHTQVFYHSPLSIALVNLKPIVPGHVLVIPKRRMDRFTRLDMDEVADLWTTAQHIAQRLEGHYAAEAFTFSIQDGVAAGQTVPHCHIHVLPRHCGDFAKNDDVYDHIDKNDLRPPMDLDANRVVRSMAEMAAEAAVLRALCN
ncbi:Aste57867_14266 [Aphanomyces stellatus]|uniref:Aste57867_14266 protein n=1 Tax=Aphanomyces stellatus TaxID=120398 RepID=A0A485L2N6_9STRA|nr:hypothetical protein As57867_014215 [Aphanomyces stellatus]VFT91091.1 Aste57867_14266 [Aphanomyces stellatus]